MSDSMCTVVDSGFWKIEINKRGKKPMVLKTRDIKREKNSDPQPITSQRADRAGPLER